MAFPTRLRLPLRFERERLSREGQRRSGHFLTLVQAPTPLGQKVFQPRFAVLVTKRVSPLSVERNRLKRLVSQATLDLLSTISPADYLLIPKKELLSAHYSEVLADLKRLYSHD